MRHIYTFYSREEYESQKQNLATPNIVYITDQEVVISNGVDEVISAMPERLSMPTIDCTNNRVTITAVESLVTIYYTTDGTEATTSSTVYTGPFTIHESCGVNALVVKYGYLPNTGYNWCEYVAPAGNVITYTGDQKAANTPVGAMLGSATIISHEFENGAGTVTCDMDITYVEKFNEYYHITSATLPDTVTTIGMNAFKQNAMPSIEIPSNITLIEQNAFSWCNRTNTITIDANGDNLTIEDGAFSHSNITELDLPARVTSLGGCFQDAANLTSITLRANSVITVNMWTMPFDLSGNFTIYVPAELVDSYKSAAGWNNYTSKIQAIPE